MSESRFPVICFLIGPILMLGSIACGGSSPPQEDPSRIELTQEPMIEIPAGYFQYGADDQDLLEFVRRGNVMFDGMIEEVRRLITNPPEVIRTESFWIDQFEVTNQSYLAFLNTTDYHPETSRDFLNHWNSPRSFPSWAAGFPVVWVSKKDAEEYCSWRGKRLPSEREWEKSARGTDGRRFPWGDQLPDSETVSFGVDQAEPVGNRPGDVSPYSVYDMAGNVSELTSTTKDVSGEGFVSIRGGSYRGGVREMFLFYRDFISTSGRFETVGFRCASDDGPPVTD